MDKLKQNGVLKHHMWGQTTNLISSLYYFTYKKLVASHFLNGSIKFFLSLCETEEEVRSD